MGLGKFRGIRLVVVIIGFWCVIGRRGVFFKGSIGLEVVRFRGSSIVVRVANDGIIIDRVFVGILEEDEEKGDLLLLLEMG